MVGRQYKFKLLESAQARTVTELRNGFVIFDDGSRIEEKRLTDLFDPVTPHAETAPIQTPVAESINTPVQPMAQEVIDPESFFENSKTTQYITQQANTINTNTLNDQGSSYTGATILEKPIAQNVEGDPNQVKRYEAQRSDFSEEDKKFAGYNRAQNAQVIPTNEVSTVSFFKNLKRIHKVKLNIEINESIPKPDFIKMMDENLDGGVLNFLVTDIVSNFLKRPQTLEKYVRDSLEEIVYKKKPVKRRTTKESKISKVKESKEEKKSDDS